MYNPATGRREFIAIGTSHEVSIGNSAASQIAGKYRLSSDAKALARLSLIGNKVASVSDRKDIVYKFYLIEDKTLNAFTIPGGHVYIYRGLYDILDDDELAGVLAHEIGHVAARHIVKRMQAMLGYQILSTIAISQYVRARQPRKQEATAVAYAASTAFNLVTLGYSRQDEFQSDRLGLIYAYKAGYDPRGLARSLEKLDQHKEKGISVPYILRSHPYHDQRIQRLQKQAENLQYYS